MRTPKTSDDYSPDDLDGVDYSRRMGPTMSDRIAKDWEEFERDGGYTRDWEEVSYKFRLARDFECQGCYARLADHQHLLHVHHISGDKGDNSESNLQALCLLCHAEEHHHMRERVSDEDRAKIEALRKLLPRG